MTGTLRHVWRRAKAGDLRIDRKILAVHTGLTAGFGIALLGTLISREGVIATDFTVFWTGWWLILHGQGAGLYDAALQRTVQQMLMAGFQFHGGLMAFLTPPHAALAGVPFGWLADHVGERAAFLLWTAGNVSLLATLDRWLREQWGATTGPARWLITTALGAFFPVFQTLNIGQTSLLLGVASLGLYRAVASSREVTGGAWLLALSIKPQLMPALLVFLIAKRCWRMLAWAGAMLLTAAAATAAVLGPTVWVHYLDHVRALESYWGTGTPGYMRNLRGFLTRVIGSMGEPAISSASYGIWIVGTVIVAVALFTWRIHKLTDDRPPYSAALAIGLLVSPHLFVADVLIWAVPLMLYTAALRDAGRDWQPFAAFALSWPVLFAVGHVIDLRTGDPALSVVSQVIVCMVATAAIFAGTRRLSQAPRRTAARA
jgi:hypothetical protein